MSNIQNLNKLKLILENIPEELKKRRQWIVYRIEKKQGKEKTDKVPYQTNGIYKASTNKPETWCTFVEALEAYQNKNFNGIGFVFTRNDPYCGIDLDDCINPETSTTKPWAKDWIDKFSSYTEYSPSRTGIHTIVKGELQCEKGIKKGDYEIYDHARYFTFTGDIIDPEYSQIEERQNVLEELYQSLNGSSRTKVETPLPEGFELSDNEIEEIINNAKAAQNGEKISKLLNGKWKDLDYPHNQKRIKLFVIY